MRHDQVLVEVYRKAVLAVIMPDLYRRAPWNSIGGVGNVKQFHDRSVGQEYLPVRILKVGLSFRNLIQRDGVSVLEVRLSPIPLVRCECFESVFGLVVWFDLVAGGEVVEVESNLVL